MINLSKKTEAPLAVQWHLTIQERDLFLVELTSLRPDLAQLAANPDSKLRRFCIRVIVNAKVALTAFVGMQLSSDIGLAHILR